MIMNRQNHIPVAIVALNNETADQDIRALRLAGFKKFKQVSGVWKGTKEASYVVPLLEAHHLLAVASLAYEHHQQAILLVDNQRGATLIDLRDGGSMVRSYLGRFISVDKHTAQQCDSYTHDEHTNTYYTVLSRERVW